MTRITKSRKFLEEDLHVVYKDGKFYQNGPLKGLREIKSTIMIKNHKYGKSIAYEYICPYNYKTHKTMIMTYHAFIYAWFKGEVPAGYDVDHIDGDTLNNDLDNLQLLTRKENLAKRGGQKNQYGFIDKEEKK